MCPSYMVTREEKHSTRGRARLLNEMIRGDVVKDGWRNEAVREALDLCLSCKGCKHDCPVQVDMATYKAEFLSHYYERRLRPRYAYASGLIYWWSRVGAHMPATANFFTQTPGLSSLAKLAAGYSQKRHIPPFAPQTFKQWFARRGVRECRQAARDPVGRHVQQPLHAGGRQGGRRGPGARGLSGPGAAAEPLLRPSALRLRHARHREASAAADHSIRCASRSATAFRSSAWSQVA